MNLSISLEQPDKKLALFGAADRHYQISIRHAVLNLAQIRYLSSHGYAMTGTLGIDAQGQGTLKSPEIQVDLTDDLDTVYQTNWVQDLYGEEVLSSAELSTCSRLVLARVGRSISGN